MIEKLLHLACEALENRGEYKLILEIEQEVVALRRELNSLKDYRDRREVDDEAQRLARTQQG